MRAFTVVDDDPAFLDSLRRIEPPGYDWTSKIRTAAFVLRSNPEAGAATQDDAVRILYFAATPGHPGLKIFYNVEGTTVTLLRGRPFDRFHEAGEI